MYSIHGKSVPYFGKKITALIATLAILLNSLIAPLPFILPQSANAITNYTEIPFSSTELSTNWATDRTTPSGGYNSTSFGGRNDVLEMRIDTANASPTSGFHRTEGIQRQIPASDTVRADLYVDSTWYSQDVRAGLWGVGNDGTGVTAYPIVEFVSGLGLGYTGWRVWDGVVGGWTNTATAYTPDAWNTLELSLNESTNKFDIYINGNLFTSNGGGGSTGIGAVILNSFNNANNNASYNYAAHWSKLSIGVDVPPTVGPCLSPSVLNSVNLSSWDLSQTRVTGHNQITEDGLHIYTEGATSTDKAAGYYTTDFALSDLGNQTIAGSIDYDISSGFGPTPGLQLVTDFDNNGTPDGILVGESVYVNSWWLSNSAAQFVKDNAPNNGGGFGSNWYGTPNEWLTKFPDARVKAIGYSLGSGVYGDGVLKRISLGCVNYTFDLPAPVPPTTPTDLRLNNVNGEFACGLVTSINYITPTWNAVAGAVSYNYRVVLPGGGMYGPINVGNVTSVSGAFGAVGLSTFSVQAVDAGGLTSDWASPCAVTYDPAVPSAPTNPRWENSAGDTLGAYTNVNLVTPIWDAPVVGPVDRYEYSFTSPISGWSAPEPFYTTSIPDQSFFGAGNTGTEGTWQFRVRTVTASGLTSAWAESPTIIYDKTAPALPVHEFPADNSLINYNNFWFEWTDAVDAVSYETQYSQNLAVNPDGAFQNVQWTGDYQNIQPTSSSAHSIGANGTWYWQVRSIDVAGNKSAWTSPWKVTIDMEAPSVPTVSFTEDPSGDSVASGGITDSQNFAFTLGSSVDTTRYQLKYWNDIIGSPFKELTPWNPSNLSGYPSALGTYGDSFTQGDGMHYFSFSSCDSAGNCSAYSAPFAVTYDSTAPTVSIVSFSATGNVITPDVTAVDLSGPLVYSWSTNPSVTISDVTALEPDFTANADGTYSFTLTATDVAGNSAMASFSFTYTAPVPVEEEETPVPQEVDSPAPPAVLGATTNGFTTVVARNSNNQTAPVPEAAIPDAPETTSEVAGASTEKLADTAGVSTEKLAAATSGNFLGLGWWWLPLILVLGFVLWLLFGRDDDDEEEEAK